MHSLQNMLKKKNDIKSQDLMEKYMYLCKGIIKLILVKS